MTAAVPVGEPLGLQPQLFDGGALHRVGTEQALVQVGNCRDLGRYIDVHQLAIQVTFGGRTAAHSGWPANVIP